MCGIQNECMKRNRKQHFRRAQREIVRTARVGSRQRGAMLRFLFLFSFSFFTAVSPLPTNPQNQFIEPSAKMALAKMATATDPIS